MSDLWANYIHLVTVTSKPCWQLIPGQCSVYMLQHFKLITESAPLLRPPEVTELDQWLLSLTLSPWPADIVGLFAKGWRAAATIGPKAAAGMLAFYLVLCMAAVLLNDLEVSLPMVHFKRTRAGVSCCPPAGMALCVAAVPVNQHRRPLQADNATLSFIPVRFSAASCCLCSSQAGGGSRPQPALRSHGLPTRRPWNSS